MTWADALAGFHMPAEWEPHERTIMGFPCHLAQWGEHLLEGQLAWAHVARTIADFEPVTMLARADDVGLATDLCAHSNVTVQAIDLDDAWLRDIGPIYSVNEARTKRIGTDPIFNVWGNLYEGRGFDDQVASRWCDLWNEPSVRVPFVLEGGSIAVDGDGTVFVTEQCLLHPNRNPTLRRVDIEDHLRKILGVTTVVWLPYSIDDRDTDGHIDLVVVPVKPGVVLFQGCDDSTDPEHDRLALSRRCLDGAVDARGRATTIIDLPVLPYAEVHGERMPVPYANLYVCNGAVIVPVTGHPADADSVAIIADAFPGRAVVGVPGDVIAYGGGGPHCITQQVPALRSTLAN
jgi:agmatine deiminase